MNKSTVLFSILIPTLEERRAQFNRLAEKLRAQIAAASLEETVEICVDRDNREKSIGLKRNELIQRARGEFIAFVDDDDEIHDNYVSLICAALRDHPHVDCLGIRGIVYFRGTHPRQLIHSTQYDHYFSRGGVYYRPPYILNPLRRVIAQRYPFEAVNFSSDIDWAMRIARDRVLQREHMLDLDIYFYFSRRHWLVQAAIDATEGIRHPLGLQFANRLRLARWLRNQRKAGIWKRRW